MEHNCGSCKQDCPNHDAHHGRSDTADALWAQDQWLAARSWYAVSLVDFENSPGVFRRKDLECAQEVVSSDGIAFSLAKNRVDSLFKGLKYDPDRLSPELVDLMIVVRQEEELFLLAAAMIAAKRAGFKSVFSVCLFGS